MCSHIRSHDGNYTYPFFTPWNMVVISFHLLLCFCWQPTHSWGLEKWHQGQNQSHHPTATVLLQLSSELLLFDFILSWRLQQNSTIGTVCPQHTLAGLKHSGLREKFSALWESPGWEVSCSPGSMSWTPRFVRRKDDFPNPSKSHAKQWGFLSFAGSIRIQSFKPTYAGVH